MFEKIPTISICNLHGEDHSVQDLVAYDLKKFIRDYKNIKFPHRHSFYQLLYITKAGGTHVIDFEKHPVKRGMVFFLAPSQVHEWSFDSDANGILINFNENYFSSFLANRHYISDFPFFTPNNSYSSIDLSNDSSLKEIEDVFLNIHKEFDSNNEFKLDIIRVMLLQMFLLVNRKITFIQNQSENKNNYLLFRNFEKLIEKNYTTIRMPKDYAKLLFVTPNHLNAICNQITGLSAGDIIRRRILLEAKRLLINSTQNINEIAWHLSFEDNSYFSKFFKKYEGITPEEFRRLKL